MIRKALLLSLAFAGLLSAKDSKSNFVFLLVDDFGPGDFGCYGAKFYEIPYIDKLAANGASPKERGKTSLPSTCPASTMANPATS